MNTTEKSSGRQSRAHQKHVATPHGSGARGKLSQTATAPPFTLLFSILIMAFAVYAPSAIPAGLALPWLNSTAAPVIAGETLSSWTAVRFFYSQRQNRPAWLTGQTLSGDARLLLDALNAAGKEGLNPADYHIFAMARGRLPADQLELLLTDAALRYAHDQMSGRFEPRHMDPEWLIAAPPAADSADALQAALDRHQLAQWLDSLPPPHPAYAQLRTALARYRSLAAHDPWPTLGEGPSIKPGAHDARIPVLRLRLESSGDLTPTAPGDATRYDASLANVVRHFQSTQGLEADGIVGNSTRAALNVSARQRVHQLQANMERWRWLPRQFGARYVLVNMAGFDLRVEEHRKPVLSMHVIVGQQLLSTPAFNSLITHIVFNPYWIIPPSIAGKDILPKLKKNPAYLTEENIQVFDRRGATALPIDPNSIEWSQITAKRFPYRLRQLPGPRNALGQVKFLLPNPYAIYLHDTPSRSLFNKSVRALSHGCIRLQHPDALADYLLRDSPRWNPAAIAAAIAAGQTRTVTLPQPLPIYMLYFTAWVDGESVVQFRNDIYARDAKLIQAFNNVN